MRPDELRAAQEPIKALYREDPAAALVTLRADGSLEDGIACSVQTGRALVEAGLHPASGGDGFSACSGDMLLQALVACAGVTMRAVAASLGLSVAGTVHAEGDLERYCVVFQTLARPAVLSVSHTAAPATGPEP